MENFNFRYLRKNAEEYIYDICDGLKHSPIVRGVFEEEIDEIITRVVALHESKMETRQEWQALVDRDIDPLLEKLNSALIERYEMDIISIIVLLREKDFHSS